MNPICSDIEGPMNAEEFLENIQGELQRRFRAAGSGSVGRVERTLNLAQGYFRDQRRPGRRRVDLKILHDALETLGVEPAEFFASVLGIVDPSELFRSRARALARRKRPSILQVLAERQGEPAEPVALDYDTLDAERDANPGSVRRTARELMTRVSDRDLPRLLGLYGSACRALGQLDEAQIVLGRALDLVPAERTVEVAELLLRCASVAGDRTHYQEAVELSEQASSCYALAGDPVGVGKALLKQGMAHGCLEEVDAELQAFQAALEFFPEERRDRSDIVRHLFSCRMNLAITYRKLDQLESAQALAGAAEELGEFVGPAQLGKLVWLRGSIALHQERYAEAEDHLQRALDMHREVAPVSCALLAVEVVQVQMLQGHTRRAHETARMMASLLRPLEGHPLGSAAITALVRCALSGRGLTLTFLERLARGIEQGREQGRSAA